MEVAVNNFIGGLNLDSHPSAVSQNSLTDALNATVRTYNGNELMLQNDMGNTMILDARTGTTVGLSEGFIPLGMKEHGGVLYIASYNPKTKEGELGSIPSPLITYTLALPEPYEDYSLLTYAEVLVPPDTVGSIESFANNTLTKISENVYSPGDCFLIVLDLLVSDKSGGAETWDYTAKDRIYDFDSGGWATFPVITKNNAKQNKGLFRIELYAETQNDSYLIGSTKSKNCLYYVKNTIRSQYSDYWFILESSLRDKGYSIDARRTLASNNFVSYPNVPEGSLSIKAAVEKPEITGFIKNDSGLNEPFVVHASYKWGDGEGVTAYQYYMTVTALEGVVSAWPIDKIEIKLQESESKKEVFNITLRNDASNALGDEYAPLNLKLKTSKSNPRYDKQCQTKVELLYACEDSLAYTSTFTQFKKGEKLYISNKWSDDTTLLNSVKFDTEYRYINPLFIYALDLQDNYKPFTFTITYYYIQDGNDYLIDTKYFYYTPIFTEKMPYKSHNGEQVTIGDQIEELEKNITIFSPCDDDTTNYRLLPIKESLVMKVDDWTMRRNLTIPNIGIQFNLMAGIYTTNDSKLFEENKGSITSVSLCLIGITPNDKAGELMGGFFDTFKDSLWSANLMGWKWAGNIAAHLRPGNSRSISYLYSPRYFRNLAPNTLLHEYSGTDLKFLTRNLDSSVHITYTECAQRGVYQTDFPFSDLTNYFRKFQISPGINDATHYDVFTPHWDAATYKTVYLERKQDNGQAKNMSTFYHFCDIWDESKAVAGFNGKPGGPEAIKDISWLTFNGSLYGYGGLRSKFYPLASGKEWYVPGELNIKDVEFNIETQYELFLATIFHVYGVKDTEVFFKSRYHQKTAGADNKPASIDTITIDFNRTYKICKTTYSENYWESFFTSALSDDLKPKLVVQAPYLYTFKYLNYDYSLFNYTKLSNTIAIQSKEYELYGDNTYSEDFVKITKSDNVYTINYTKSENHTVYGNVDKSKNNYNKKNHGSDDFYALYLKDKFYINLDKSITEIDLEHIEDKLLKTDSYLYYQTIVGDIINVSAYNTDDVSVINIILIVDTLPLSGYASAKDFSSSSFNSDWDTYFYFKNKTSISCNNGYYKIVGALYTNNTWKPLNIDDCILLSNGTITVPSNCIVEGIYQFEFNVDEEEWFPNRKDEIFGECCVIAEQGLKWGDTTYNSIIFPPLCEHLIITDIVPVTEIPQGSDNYKVKTSVKLQIKQ